MAAGNAALGTVMWSATVIVLVLLAVESNNATISLLGSLLAIMIGMILIFVKLLLFTVVYLFTMLIPTSSATDLGIGDALFDAVEGIILIPKLFVSIAF